MTLDILHQHTSTQSAPDANGWMPIETAPMDGPEFVVCLPRQGMVMLLVRYNKLGKRYEKNGEPVYLHSGDVWQPLPKPPVTP